MGYWRLMDWNMSARQLVSFIEEHLVGRHRRLTMRTFMAVISAKRRLAGANAGAALREKLQIVTKCGIATTARAEK